MNADALIAACLTEQIQKPGAIQGWGALVIATADDPVVSHASANLQAFLGVAGADAIGRRLDDLLGGEIVAHLLAATADGDTGEASLAARAEGLPPLLLIAHRHNGQLYVECEPAGAAMPGTRSTHRIIERLRAAVSMVRLLRTACDELRHLTGFDRVLAYRFDADRHGEVMAESRVSKVGSLLGLHYPADDVPPQARAIFARLPVRVIGNSHAAPVPLLPAAAPGAEPDLSLCALRMPSACHMEYLRNMGSHATVTVALTVDGALWGLLACHHGAPAHLPPERRALCGLIGQVTSLALVTLREAQTMASAAAARQRLRDMSVRLAARQDDPEPLGDMLTADSAGLLSLCEAQGAVVRLGGRTVCIGSAPPAAAADKLLDALIEVLPGQAPGEGDGVFDSDSLGAVIDRNVLADAGQPAGALLLPLPHMPGDAIAWLRPEQPLKVDWGGNPNLPMIFDPDRGRLGPRASFRVWREVVRGRSLPWQDEHRRAALGLAGVIETTLAGYVEPMRLAAAERAALAKAEFLAMMSHAIHLPLGGLLDGLALLRATALDAEQSRVAGMIQDSAAVLAGVLNEVLTFSKIEAGRAVEGQVLAGDDPG